MLRAILHFWIGGILVSAAAADPALIESQAFPSALPGPAAEHPGIGCFWLASGSIVPEDVDWIQVTLPFSASRTIIDVDFAADAFPEAGSRLLVWVVSGSTVSSIDDLNTEPDSVCGLHGASTPVGSLKDSVVDLGAMPGPAVIHIGITGQGVQFGSHSHTFDYDVWVFAVDESLACLTDEDCDDWIDCSVDRCIDGACFHDPDDGFCDNGIFCDGVELCDPDVGCVTGAPSCPSEFCDEAAGACLGVSAVVDLRPGGCPNVFNPSSRGVLPAALLSTADFDVHSIDMDSLRLSRADGVGGDVRPVTGPPGPRAIIVPAGAAFARAGCNCAMVGGVGGSRMLLKFNARSLTSELQLDDPTIGATVDVILSGELIDGTPFEGTDCLHLVPSGGRE